MNQQTHPDDNPLDYVKSRIDEHELTVETRQNFESHLSNLTSLAERLEQLGLSKEEIDNHVIEIFLEYERELIANVARIRAAQAEIADSHSEHKPIEH